MNLAVGFKPTVSQGNDGRVASATPEDLQPSLTRRAGFLTKFPALKRRARINSRYAAKTKLPTPLGFKLELELRTLILQSLQ